MKKLIALAMACVMCLGVLAGCAKKDEAPAQVDLQAFYDTITAENEFGFLELADDEITEFAYPGLKDIPADQRLVYVCMMSMNNGEFVLMQVTNSEDVEAAKGILQARIDSMAQGGAFYPEATEMWTQNSAVVSNGNYIMMVVHENHEAIAEAFNALF